MRYLSLCSGIEAASVAWQPFGWGAVAFAEIEPFPCAVLSHHYPNIPNLGDMTTINGSNYRGAVDLVVAGTPCQDFSVAGKRAGLAGERSGLALVLVRLLSAIRPQWLVWENVPGVFSTNGGRDFGSFIKALDDIGYSCAWRVLDAQYFGVPQRRRRVFLVSHLGDWRPAAAVLFEPNSLCRDIAKGRKKRSHVTQALTGRLGGGGPDDNKAQGGFYVPDIVPQAMSCKWSKGTSGPAGDEHHNLVCAPITTTPYADNEAQESRLVLSARTARTSINMTHPPGQKQGLECCIALHPHSIGRKPEAGPQAKDFRDDSIGYTMDARGVAQCVLPPLSMQVRRLTPRECERLQGFPDDYTNIEFRGKPAADALRYKALGNSMAVPVMRWIGERIQKLLREKCDAAMDE